MARASISIIKPQQLQMADLTHRGHKSPQAMTPSSSREQITVQTCISGTGKLMVSIREPECLSSTQKGTFGNQVQSHRERLDECRNILQLVPVNFHSITSVLQARTSYLDGHKSHVGYQIRRKWYKNPDITSTHNTLASTARCWCVQLHQTFMARNPGYLYLPKVIILKKGDFPKLLTEVWQKSKPDEQIGGFQKAGVVQRLFLNMHWNHQLLYFIRLCRHERRQSRFAEITLAEELSTHDNNNDDEDDNHHDFLISKGSTSL